VASTALLERLGVELPIVQAGMGGGIAGHELAAAVSEAGGLGTIGLPGPGAGDVLASELDAARGLTSQPLAVNLLLPFARRADFEVAERADAVVTFWGRPRRRTGGVWLHQCGSVEEARAAHAAGADGAILQGVEAGGHVRGTVPAQELLDSGRSELPAGFELWVAGGIGDGGDVRAALEAGAGAAVLGTRFLLSEEAAAHPLYKERLLSERETVLTELFGLGWPAAPHRVVPNDATRRWLANDRRGPAVVRAVNRLSAPLATRMPPALQRRTLAWQTPRLPLLSAAPPGRGAPESLIESGPLYAGETVARIEDLRPAAGLVADLAP
jgi:nitronate monooxygenase